MPWTTERLTLSTLADEDAPELFEALDDPEVGRYIGGPDVTTVEALRDRIAFITAGPGPGRDDERWLNVAVRAEGRVIGRLEATLHEGWAEVAWVFGPAWWGRGYATEGAAWLLAHLRDDDGITEAWATVDPANGRSVRLIGRLGFREQVPPFRRRPASYDDGDLVFARDLEPVPGADDAP